MGLPPIPEKRGEHPERRFKEVTKMNWRTIFFVFLAVSLSLTSFATADSGSTYGGLSAGSALPEGNTFDNAVGWRVFLGYEIQNNISMEAGYTSFGEMDGPSILGVSTTIEPKGLEIALIERYLVNYQLEFFLKLGLLNWDLKVNKAGLASSNTTGKDIFFGLGWEYDLTEVLGLRAAWDRYKIQGIKVDFFSSSLVYEF